MRHLNGIELWQELTTTKITEKSVLDYFIVNLELFNDIVGIEID